MEKVLKFKLEVKELEDKLNRIVEISDEDNLMHLGCLVLATFESYINESFIIYHGNNVYDSVCLLFDNKDSIKSSCLVKLKDIDFKENQMIMEFNKNALVTFVITFLGSRDKDENKYPKVLEGSGKGIIDFEDTASLKQIITDTDKNGYSSYTLVTEVDGKDEEEIIDYRDFDLESNNMLSNFNYKLAYDDYLKIYGHDYLRIIKNWHSYYLKLDTLELVSPSDYYHKYISDDYESLSKEEQAKIIIPRLEEFNIHKLPDYSLIEPKDIMSSFVKYHVTDKEERKILFYALRNDEFIDKFHNELRKLLLFKEYYDYSSEYYEGIYNKWKEKIDKGEELWI